MVVMMMMVDGDDDDSDGVSGCSKVVHSEPKIFHLQFKHKSQIYN